MSEANIFFLPSTKFKHMNYNYNKNQYQKAVSNITNHYCLNLVLGVRASKLALLAKNL